MVRDTTSPPGSPSHVGLDLGARINQVAAVLQSKTPRDGSFAAHALASAPAAEPQQSVNVTSLMLSGLPDPETAPAAPTEKATGPPPVQTPATFRDKLQNQYAGEAPASVIKAKGANAKFAGATTLSKIDFYPSDMASTMQQMLEMINEWLVLNQDAQLVTVETLEFEYPELPMWAAYVPGAIGVTQYRCRIFRVWYNKVGAPNFDEKFVGGEKALAAPQVFSRRPPPPRRQQGNLGSHTAAYSKSYSEYRDLVQLLLIVIIVCVNIYILIMK